MKLLIIFIILVNISQSWSYVYSNTSKGTFGAITFNQKSYVFACALYHYHPRCDNWASKAFCNDYTTYHIMFLRISDPINQENPRYIENAHDDGIRSVSFNSVTNMLASGSSDNTVKLWKTNDISMCQSDINKCLYATLRFHQDSVNIVLFNEKTNVLASGADDNYICIWNVKDMKYQSLYDHSGPVLSLAFNEQTNVLASGSSDKTIKLWNLNFDMLNLRPFRTLSHSGPVISLSFNQNRNTLASCTSTEIKEWIASTDNHMLVSGAYSSLTSIAYNVNTNVLYRAENGLFFVILPTNNFIVKTENKIEW